MKRVISFLLVLSVVLASFTNASLDVEASSSGKGVYDVIWLDEGYHYVGGFGDLGDFHEGMAVVEKDGLYGYIDKTGKEVLLFEDSDGEYWDLHDFSEGVALVEKTRFQEGVPLVKCGILKNPLLGDKAEEIKKEEDLKIQANEEVNATATPCNLSLDGEKIDIMEVYLIDGHNYFKLRDVAKLADATDAKFSIAWNGEKKLISIETGKSYDPIGTELNGGNGKDKIADKSTAKVEIDSKEVDLNAYLIEGENYFQIRDLGKHLGFGVGWNEESRTIELKMNR